MVDTEDTGRMMNNTRGELKIMPARPKETGTWDVNTTIIKQDNCALTIIILLNHCYLNQSYTYHDEPWGSQGPKHTQQKSNLHFLHTMWLHPPSFSMVAWHCGHS